VVWHLAALGWTVEQIVDELSKYPNGIGLKYVGRLLTEVTCSFGKWQRRRRAHAQGAAAAANTPWPQIKIVPGELPRVVNEAEDALLLLPGREIYQRGGMLVRPVLNQSLKASADRNTESWQLVAVTRSHLVEILCYAAQFLRYDKRGQKFVPADAPADSPLSAGVLGRWSRASRAAQFQYRHHRGDACQARRARRRGADHLACLACRAAGG